MKSNFKKSMSLFVLMLSALFIYCQEEGSYYVIKTKDGNIYKGIIIENKTDSVVLNEQTLGMTTLIRSNIRSMKESNNVSIKNGEVDIHSSAASRYFFAPSSFGLEKNEAYYQNFMIFYNHFSYGVSDNFTIGATVIPTFLFIRQTPVALSAKYSTPLAKNVHWGVGALAGTILGSGDDFENSGGVIGYTTLTLGNKQNNITGGYGLTKDEENLFVVSANLRLSRKFHFMTENYFVPGGEGFFSLFGARYLGRSVTFDFGVMRPFITDEDFLIVGIPFVGVTFPLSFGNNNEVAPKQKTKKKTK